MFDFIYICKLPSQDKAVEVYFNFMFQRFETFVSLRLVRVCMYFKVVNRTSAKRTWVNMT